MPDGSGRNRHIVHYQEWTDHETVLYARNLSSWLVEPVENQVGFLGGAPSIAIDKTDGDKIHFGYLNGSGGYFLMYAVYNGFSWHKMLVESGNQIKGTSIAVDSSHKVHMSYMDITSVMSTMI